MNSKIYRYKWNLLLLLALLSLVGCDQLSSFMTNQNTHENSTMHIVQHKFSEDYKELYIDLKFENELYRDILIKNCHIDTILINETIVMTGLSTHSQPKLLELSNIISKKFRNANHNLLVIVDLTLSEEKIKAQKSALEQLYRVFEGGLYVSFIGDSKMTESIPVTDYVLSNKFIKKDDKSLLYRAILSKYDELTGNSSKFFPKVPQLKLWDSLEYSQKAIIAFSNEDVYLNGIPEDTDHFYLQTCLSKIGGNGADAIKSQVPIYYVSFRDDNNIDEATEDVSGARYRLTSLTNNSGGAYYKSFNLSELIKSLEYSIINRDVDFQLILGIPENSIYKGELTNLNIKLISADTLLAENNLRYSMGNYFDPIVVNNVSTGSIIFRGLITGVIILLLIYVIFQYIHPYIAYMLFKKNHITTYKNQLMSVNNNIIKQCCYYCRSPFALGDMIVTKCKHTVHLDCWNENNYSCPEYGEKCKIGSHYYNSDKLYDPKNSSYYFKWILSGTIAGILSWFCFYVISPIVPHTLIKSIILEYNDIQANTPQADLILQNFGSQIISLPLYGANIGLWLTLAIGIFKGRGRWNIKRMGLLALNSLLGLLSGYCSFLIACTISIILGVVNNSIIVYIVAWMLMGSLLTIILTHSTRITFRKAMVGVIITIGVGLISLYLFDLFLDMFFDFRILLMYNFLIYSIGFAISLAVVTLKSKRYFLHIEGGVKPIDIAIYKWFTTAKLTVATIGKSVDCNLQMSWDIRNNLAPIQVSLKKIKSYIYVTIEERGVFIDNIEVPIGKSIKLYHSTSFKIGDTTFTYIEKDF